MCVAHVCITFATCNGLQNWKRGYQTQVNIVISDIQQEEDGGKEKNRRRKIRKSFLICSSARQDILEYTYRGEKIVDPLVFQMLAGYSGTPLKQKCQRTSTSLLLNKQNNMSRKVCSRDIIRNTFLFSTISYKHVQDENLRPPPSPPPPTNPPIILSSCN